MAELSENVIEWITGDETISVTVSQKKFVNRIKRFALTDENVVILAENNDGSVFAHLPISYLKLSPKRTVNQTVQEKSEWAEKMRKSRRK